MRHVRPMRRPVNVSLVVLFELVVLDALLALTTIMTARALHVPSHDNPQTCQPPARYATVAGVHEAANGRADADHHADGASCMRPSAPIPPFPPQVTS
jgi:hypothetical protein